MRLLLVAASFALCLPALAQACSKPAGASSLEAGMIAWINQQRQANGLSALRPSADLAAAAENHACDMATRGYFAHQRPGGPKLSARVKAEGYRMRRVAENIAKSPGPDVAAAAKLWRTSPPHWANILKTGVQDIGLAVATDGSGVYWVMNIGAER